MLMQNCQTHVEIDTFEFLQPKLFGERKQVGLFGGNFNPIHLGHLVIADQVFHQLCLDQFYFLPSYLPPHVDEKKTIDAKIRLEMLQLALADRSDFEIETIEIERKGKSYTYETICELKERNPQVDYYFIIGGDMVEYLPKWHQIDKLAELVQFVGVKRSNYPVETPYPVIWVDVPFIDISSSLIRKQIQKGGSIRYFVPKAVEEYINERGLYRHE